ncbi:MAG: hypothetical protein AVDCRST_MAG68-2010 [uncultured Gemmatimonadetes bacterium]|uniref:Uncharacterized protein n=1 Tax=uncultured Gemmatimonadota bacterium TaxID=203437 RepID=A0A6J4L5I2_9BACT|nr:MAG: hypothetical protein AVDCRST_MAG68-2010 [uncultured Gemmatimonadota bacterium]
MIDSDQGPHLDALWQVLSRERLEGGYGGSAMRRQDVIVRYLWNVALCEALYPSLQSLEVALRNTLFNAGEAVYPFTGTPAAPAQHALAHDLIGWMSPSLRQTVEALDRFNAVHSAGLEPFRRVTEDLVKRTK